MYVFMDGCVILILWKISPAQQLLHQTYAQVRYVVIGGGIAGVSCAQELASLTVNVDASVHLISASGALKASQGSMEITKHLEEFVVYEKSSDVFRIDHPNIEVSVGVVKHVDPLAKKVILDSGSDVYYDKLCICTGAKPTMLLDNHPRIIGLRDVDR
jgi:NADH dehydrogenase FAD-containing subunit